MGAQQYVTFGDSGVPRWSVVHELLQERGFPVEMRMINGELAFPDETPDETAQATAEIAEAEETEQGGETEETEQGAETPEPAEAPVVEVPDPAPDEGQAAKPVAASESEVVQEPEKEQNPTV